MAPSQVSFTFVSVTSSAPELDAQSRGLIKKHVMKDIGFARRRFRQKEARDAESEKESSKLSPSGHTSSHKAHTSNPTENGAASKSAEDLELLFQLIRSTKPSKIVGAGCIDPFASFPIQGDVEVDTLIDHSKF
jgi:hypothetical protein